MKTMTREAAIYMAGNLASCLRDYGIDHRNPWNSCLAKKVAKCLLELGTEDKGERMARTELMREWRQANHRSIRGDDRR